VCIRRRLGYNIGVECVYVGGKDIHVAAENIYVGGEGII
jgi:hypothetical protein